VPEPVITIGIEGAPEGPAGLCGLDEVALRAVVAHALTRVGITRAVELSILVTGDDALRTLNRDYRGRDEATDVLSFPLLDAPLAQAPAEQLWSAVADEPDDQASMPAEGNPTQRGGDTYVVSYEEGDHDADGEVDTADEPFVFVAPPGMPLHLGDIVISRDATERQAAQAGHSAAWELAYLVAHGVLHLVGYDDHTDAGYTAMVAHQEAAVAAAGIAR
jgi:probable rRNA maturation factor